MIKLSTRITAILIPVLVLGLFAIPVLAQVQPADQLTGTTTPISAITQRVYGKALKITGLTSLLPLCLSSDNIATTTGCTISSTPGGSDTQVQFNDGGSFGGSAFFTFNKTTGQADLSKLTITSGTSTNATSTNFFSTTASSTNLFSSLAAIGGVPGLNVISSGNVGIGTTTPPYKLTVQGMSGSALNVFSVASSTGADMLTVSSRGAVYAGAPNVSLSANAVYANVGFGADQSGTQIITNNFSNAITASVAGVGNEIRFAGSQEFQAGAGGNFTAASINTNTGNILSGVIGSANVQSAAGRANTLRGGSFSASTNDATGGTFATVAGIRSVASVVNAGATATNLYGLHIADFTIAGTASNTYGINIGDITAGTQTNQAYSIFASDANARNYFAGNVGIGTSNPAYTLDVSGTIRVSSSGRLIAPTSTAPTLDTSGSIALDTTSNNLVIATSTTGHVVAASATTTLYSFSVASTSPDMISGGILYMPAHHLPQVATAIICKADAGTSVVINLSSEAGSSDTNTITCTTTSTQFSLTSNNSFSAYAVPRLEVGTITGAVDYLTIRVIGYRTTD